MVLGVVASGSAGVTRRATPASASSASKKMKWL
jgi:hypothetical protein